MSFLKTLSAIRLVVTGARGPVGIDIDGDIQPGQFVVKKAGGSRKFQASSGTGADAGLRTDLAASTGGGIVGWIRQSTGAVARNIATKLDEMPATVRDFGAATNGTTDARAAFAAADATGGFDVPPGLYLVASSLTIASRVRFLAGARLVIPAGVTVTFNGGIEAPDAQIFNITGSGAVAGLRRSLVAWFAGDLVNTSTDATASIQKAYDASIQSGEVEWPTGSLSIGATGITASKGQQTRGHGRKTSLLKFLTTTTNGLLYTGGEGAIVEGLGMDTAAIDTIATAGSQLSFSGSAVNTVVRDCGLSGGFNALVYDGINGAKASDLYIAGAMNTGIWMKDAVNVAINNCDVSAFSDWINLSTTAGFLPGESLSWSGGNGTYGYTASGTRAKIIINNLSPANGVTITGTTSGTTATVSSTALGHATGGLYMSGNAAAPLVTASQFAGGKVTVGSFAPTNAHGSRPEYGIITGCYFDHGFSGALLDALAGFVFNGCWFTGRTLDGCTLTNSLDTDFIGCKFDSSWRHGVVIGAGSTGTKILGGYAASNNGSSTLSGDGIHVAAGVTDFVITGVRSGGQTAPVGTQRVGIYVEAGGSDRYIIEQNLVSLNALDGVSDNGTGTNKSVARNLK